MLLEVKIRGKYEKVQKIDFSKFKLKIIYLKKIILKARK